MPATSTPAKPPAEKAVYLTLRTHLQGTNSTLRNAKSIRKFLEKQQEDHQGLRQFINNHSLEHVCKVAEVMLKDRIFESTLVAKARFPDLFEVSAVQRVAQKASETKAAKAEAKAIKGSVTPTRPVEQSTPASQNKVADPPTEADIDRAQCDKMQAAEETFFPCQDVVRSSTPSFFPQLHPVYLPLPTQIKLLANVQTALELACFDFGQVKLKKVMDGEGWDCPESAELNLWCKVFAAHPNVFEPEELQQAIQNKPLAELLESIAQVRHSAVHRSRAGATLVEQYMTDAEALALLLKDDACVRRISYLRQETQTAIAELQRVKDLLGHSLTKTLQIIAMQRDKLDRAEHEAVEGVIRDDRQHQYLAGAALNRAMATITEIGSITPEAVDSTTTTTNPVNYGTTSRSSAQVIDLAWRIMERMMKITMRSTYWIDGGSGQTDKVPSSSIFRLLIGVLLVCACLVSIIKRCMVQST
ncbi:hypothetical protein AAFC00_000872 [Neodothiora populina]|uniref:Ubiquinol-cytochrome-c reductase cytochrome c1 n=1 Tax=Neodothiora populina TaxID=2781224 RepID=A0ABR3PME2_9PEZI